jgi:predicted RNA-binding Zn-ribbon protein involved in translation (DUF1610 family)
MSDVGKMICPDCGAEMNHHAVKVDYGVDDAPNSIFGGVLKEIHTCPECGRLEMRATYSE